MRFESIELHGAYLIHPEKKEDSRGFFARTFCKKQFAQKKLHTDFVQMNISYNAKKGTVRGLHYQVAPYEEVKVVSCHRGAIFDVVVDIRRESPTYGQWRTFELNEDNGVAFYVPAGFAHGFQTLCDDTEVLYQMSEYYEEKAASGIVFDDPSLKISWPEPISMVSDRDRAFPKFST